MDLKVKFSLIFSLLVCLLLALFSSAVYIQVEKKLLNAVRQSLYEHLEHEWRHLQLKDEQYNNHTEGASTLPSKNIFHKIWRGGALIRNNFPSEIALSVDDTSLKTNNFLTDRIKHKLNGEEYVIVGYSDLSSTREYLSALRRALVIACLAVLALVLPLSIFLTRSLLSPFRNLAQKTQDFDVHSLAYRFPEPKRKDEFGILVGSFNRLLERLEVSFKQVNRFARNASHELRTPLTVIRGEADLLLRKPRPTEVYEEGLTKIRSHSENLQYTVARLLALADLERIEKEREQVAIDVKKSLEDSIASLNHLHRNIKKEIKLEGDDTVIYGHRELFSSIITNILENALKFSKSTVHIQVTEEKSGVVLKINDDGAGFEEHSAKNDLYPTKESLSEPLSKGHGLGLSIVKACVTAAHGTLGFSKGHLGGLEVRIFIPKRMS